MQLMNLLEALIGLPATQSDRNVLIDGGCNIGQFSSQLVQHFPSAEIFAYEPDPESVKKAKQNFKENPNITFVEAALGASNTLSKLFRGPFSATNSLLARPKNDLKPYYPSNAVLNEETDVEVVSLDTEAKKNQIEHIDLLKLDLQGGELEALKGASNLLSNSQISIILAEAVFIQKYHDQPLLWKLWQYLESYQYSLYSLEDIKTGDYDSKKNSLRNQQWNQCDAIFISKEIRLLLDR